MSTIHAKSSLSESVSIADDGEGTTKHQVAMLGPPRPTAATVTADHSDRDDAESAASVMSGNLEANDMHNSGAPAFSNEIGASPSQRNTPLPLTQDGSPQATADMQGRSIDVNSGDSQSSDVPVGEGNLVNEDKNATNQEHTCGCQSQKLTGWAAVEKTLTDFDREEVGGCKEDIDSLLTFAGLYSGVLTAFVIVSFTQLSEDTAAESLRVLRIIANQTSGNSVSPPPTFTNPSPFQPSLAAKRVNVLWFASLVISLSTASFSILVKQWLRSYLAFASSSPQGALRIRHFRRAGLEAWRVFGIASMLPFLLQISLALFFVGLCFFTADIDPTIGNTTLPLVCAWAFLFITVTLSPIFSAKCPYKTPAVSPVTTMLRRYIGHTLARWGRASAAYLLVEMLLVPFGFIIITSLWAITDKLKFRLSDEAINGLERRVFQMRENRDEGLKRAPLEEADVRVRNLEDMAILITADSIQSNTEPDLITLEAALKQTNPSWEETMLLLLQIIGNRVPLSTDITARRMQLPIAMIDCSSLSARTRAHLVDLFQRYVIGHLPEELWLTIRDGSDSEYKAEIEQSTGASILLVWAMTIHIAFYPEYTQLPERLLASVDRALEYLCRMTDWSWAVDEHQVALAACWRITRDNVRARVPDKVQSAAAVLLDYYWPQTKLGDIATGNIPANASLLALVFQDAAWTLVRDLEQETIEVERTLSVLHFERAITLVTVLCMLSQRYQNGVDEILPYEAILQPLVVVVFTQKSWRAKKAILNAVSPTSCGGAFDYCQDKVDYIRYCKFLMDTFSHNSETVGHDLMDAILQFAAIPIDERCWEDIIGRSVVIMRLLESSSPESRQTNAPLWRRIFFVLSRLMHYLVIHLSSAQRVVEVPGTRFSTFSLPDWVKSKCGYRIDEILESQIAFDSVAGAGLPRTSEQIELQHRNSPPRSYIPDYFCLMLGGFTESHRDDGTRVPMWTARHLRNISTEERDRIVEEEQREMEDSGIDAIIADARESYID